MREDDPRATPASNGYTSMSRLPRWLTIVALVLCSVGCTAAPGPLKKLPLPFGGGMKEQALRKQVDADSFPTAKQAGL
jgi:hypothetical protein